MWVMKMTIGTFFLAVFFGFISQMLLKSIDAFVLSLLLLLVIVFTGIVSDTVGTAAAAGEEAPLNAKATRKIFGAQKGVYLVRHADQVANFCNDVIGDITGILSGAVGTVLVLQLIVYAPDYTELYFQILMTAAVTSITVGGKAWGKFLALNRSTEIMLLAGRVLSLKDVVWEQLSRKKSNNK